MQPSLSSGLLQPPSQNSNAVTCTPVHHQPSSQHSLLHPSQQHPISTSLNQAQPVQSAPTIPDDHPDRFASSTSVQPSPSAINPRIAACRSPCTVQGCQALIAPSMWHSHMQLHAHGIISGEVPTSWLNKQGLFIIVCRIVYIITLYSIQNNIQDSIQGTNKL